MTALGSIEAAQMRFPEPERCQAQPMGPIPASLPPGHSQEDLSATGIYCTVLNQM